MPEDFDKATVETIADLLGSMTGVNKSVYKLMYQDAERAGITVQQLKVITRLYWNPNISLEELAELLFLSSGTVSGIVDRMVKAGFVARDRSLKDRRALVLHLTEAGVSKLVEALGPHSLFLQAMYRVLELPPERLQTMREIHQEVLAKIENTGGEENK